MTVCLVWSSGWVSSEKNCWWQWLTFRQPERVVIFFDSEDNYRSGCRTVSHFTNSSFQNCTHPDDHTRQATDTPGFKPFTKNNGLALLLKTILQHWNCFSSSVAPDHEDENGLKLEKIGPIVSRFNATSSKLTKIIVMATSPEEIHLISSSLL